MFLEISLASLLNVNDLQFQNLSDDTLIVMVNCMELLSISELMTEIDKLLSFEHHAKLIE